MGLRDPHRPEVGLLTRGQTASQLLPPAPEQQPPFGRFATAAQEGGKNRCGVRRCGSWCKEGSLWQAASGFDGLSLRPYVRQAFAAAQSLSLGEGWGGGFELCAPDG